MNIRRDDTVLIVKGRDRGKQGQVQQTFPKEQKVLVEGMNVVLRHTKPSGQGGQSGIVQKELPLQASNVMLVCTHCTKPARIDRKRLVDGTKARICNRCKEVIE